MKVRSQRPCGKPRQRKILASNAEGSVPNSGRQANGNSGRASGQDDGGSIERELSSQRRGPWYHTTARPTSEVRPVSLK
jgi:hypothetical protein